MHPMSPILGAELVDARLQELALARAQARVGAPVAHRPARLGVGGETLALAPTLLLGATDSPRFHVNLHGFGNRKGIAPEWSLNRGRQTG